MFQGGKRPLQGEAQRDIYNPNTCPERLHKSSPAEADWKSLRPYFGCQSELVIQDTYKVTSSFGGILPQHDYLKKHYKSRNPAFNFNIPSRNEPVVTDTAFSDTPAINDGSTMAQVFVGKDTLVCDSYGIKMQNSSSTHSIITSRPEVPWIPSSQMVVSMKSPSKLLTFLGVYSLNNMNQKPIISIITMQNRDMVLSRGTSIP